MDNYWYVSLNHHYPKPMKNQHKRVVMSVQIKKDEKLHHKKLTIASCYIAVMGVGMTSMYKRI